ncbi:MAG: hypothetical protein C5B52_13780 [Bacteroidetes bacterium]|nr:MAG: hypothetical protein C5B52_13780 [Bacteroidota bacterium]
MRKNKNAYVVHALAWGALYLFWVMVFQKRAFAISHTATIEFCYLVFIAINFYYNVYFAIPRFLYKRKYVRYALLFVCGITIAAILRVPVAAYLNSAYFFPGKPQPSYQAIFITSFVNILLWTLCIVSGKIILDRFRFQQQLEQITKEKSKVEMEFLNAQFNPHFLFNSLHSIFGNIEKQNSTARNMLLNFSEMLRYQLYDCNRTSVPIEKEINYLQNYVHLQKPRKEEDLTVNFLVEDNVRGFEIAPLLFITFVENAFKYVGSGLGSEVNIEFRKNENELLFTCSNTTDHPDKIERTSRGIGLNNARRRLALQYGDRHELAVNESETFFAVNLKIELNEN